MNLLFSSGFILQYRLSLLQCVSKHLPALFRVIGSVQAGILIHCALQIRLVHRSRRSFILRLRESVRSDVVQLILSIRTTIGFEGEHHMMHPCHTLKGGRVIGVLGSITGRNRNRSHRFGIRIIKTNLKDASGFASCSHSQRRGAVIPEIDIRQRRPLTIINIAELLTFGIVCSHIDHAHTRSQVICVLNAGIPCNGGSWNASILIRAQILHRRETLICHCNIGNGTILVNRNRIEMSISVAMRRVKITAVHQFLCHRLRMVGHIPLVAKLNHRVMIVAANTEIRARILQNLTLISERPHRVV